MYKFLIFILFFIYVSVSCVSSDWRMAQTVCSPIIEIGGCNRHSCGVRLKNDSVTTVATPVIGMNYCYVVGDIEPKLIKWKWWTP